MSIAEKGIDEALAVATAALAMSAATTSHGRASESGHTNTYIHTVEVRIDKYIHTYIHAYIHTWISSEEDGFMGECISPLEEEEAFATIGTPMFKLGMFGW